MDNKKEYDILVNHLLDLANKAYYSSSFTFSDFLSEGELGDILCISPEVWPVKFSVYGGHEEATRCILRFGDTHELGYEEPFPIKILKVTPVNVKFSEELSHRDYLGSLMNLNIDRKLLGDILVSDREAYLFCESKICDFLKDEWCKVKHTIIRTEEASEIPEGIRSKTTETKLTVSSLRLDLVTAKITKLSRKEMAKYFIEKKVFVNGKNITNSSYILKENDRISVRGFGKFIYVGTDYTTKKGNLAITIQKYIM